MHDRQTAPGRIAVVRTYSHGILSLAAARLVAPRGGGPSALPALGGGALPDLPMAAGLAWAAGRRLRFGREVLEGEVCSRRRFAAPDAALHSALPVAVTLAVVAAAPKGRWKPGVLAFGLGWAGHVVSDALTHGSDARPILWPISPWRFRSPISYRERERHARLVGSVEHAADLAALAWLLLARRGPGRVG